MKVRNLSEESLHLCLEKDLVVVKQGQVIDMPEWVYKMLKTTARLEIVEEKADKKEEEPKKEAVEPVVVEKAEKKNKKKK